jgi:hypothetical protein
VAGRRISRLAHVGGGSIPKIGSTRVRIATASVALLIAGALAVGPAAIGNDRRGFLIALGAIGIVAIALALTGTVGATWWGVIALGAEFATLQLGRGPADLVAAYAAASLILLAELVMWSLDARSPVVDEAGATSRRVIDLVVLTVGSLVLGSLIVGAGRLGNGRGLLPTVIGVVGSIGVLVIIARLSVARASRQRTTG